MKLLKLLYILFFAIQLISICLVTKGFLLVREQLSDTSLENPFNNQTKWFDQKAKVIVLIIDALRFDFFHYNKSIENQEQYPYQNKFKKLNKILEKEHENYILFKAHADAPTVTTHRVQSFLIGNIPPFIKLTENFWSSEVSISLFSFSNKM